MLSMIEIENFKSIEKLTLKPGRVNVFIGENGCGKSNILEAIGFAAAAEANKLDNEFLVSRGIRVAEPKMMQANFKPQNRNHFIKIKIGFAENRATREYKVYPQDNGPFSIGRWHISSDDDKTPIELLQITEEKKQELENKLVEAIKELNPDYSPDIESRKKLITRALTDAIGQKITEDHRGHFNNYIIYSPENTALRNFYREGQIEPLGINGEGLLRLLKVIKETTPEKLEIINESLALFGWYESLDIPTGIDSQEAKIRIKDRFIDGYFDQRSANEGFLFILFYTALMVSEDTPSVFAVDNVDASLNPKLCTKLITMMAQLAEEFDKQIFLTSHNPAILDGLDLTDDNQKLFVVSRNKSGHTRCKNITADNLPVSSSGEPIKLSEALLRGYIGGLPKSF